MKEGIDLFKRRRMAVLCTAFCCAASVTAAQPFEDVPQGHWAYEALDRLGGQGLVSGFGDGTYRGEQRLTRYELAQLTARLMTQKDVTVQQRRELDKLAAEFAAELQSLGVRVAALEKKTDNIHWAGELRHRYIARHYANDLSSQGRSDHKNTNQLLWRFEPTIDINKHWTGGMRLNYFMDMKSAANVSSSVVDRAWVRGRYGSTEVKLGKLLYTSAADSGMVMDDMLTGGMVTLGRKLCFTAVGGRYSVDPNNAAAVTANYRAAEIFNSRKDKIRWGVGYQQLQHDRLENEFRAGGRSYGDDALKIVNAGIGFRPWRNTEAKLSYAWNTAGETAPQFRRAYNAELSYKGARRSEPGSFGLFAAYRHLGSNAVIFPHYLNVGGMLIGQRGIEAGCSYVPAKNIVGTVRVFDGIQLGGHRNNEAGNRRARTVFTQLDFWF